MESLVSLGWCIRRGTRRKSDGDADYLPPSVVIVIMMVDTRKQDITTQLNIFQLMNYVYIITDLIQCTRCQTCERLFT